MRASPVSGEPLAAEARMPTLLCTAKYRKAFGLPELLPPEAIDEGALGPWYANTLNVGPQRLLHFMSEPTLMSVVIPVKERHTVALRFVEALAELLLSVGSNRMAVLREVDLFEQVQFGRSSDKSKLGSLRDQALMAGDFVRSSWPLYAVNQRLSETPCGPMKYATPQEVAPARLAERWLPSGA